MTARSRNYGDSHHVIYFNLSHHRETVILLARDGVVVWKYEAKITPQHARKIVGQLLSRVPEADVRETYDDGGFRRKGGRVKNVREWEKGPWKPLKADEPTHEQITPDGQKVSPSNPPPKLVSVDLSDIDVSPPKE